MKILSIAVIAALSIGFSGYASADVENLSDWQSDGDGVWTYDQADNSWYQAKNTTQAVFLYDPDSQALGKAITGRISVNESGDDDVIGFALGYEAGDMSNENADYWMVSWKKGNQQSWTEGLNLWHITGSLSGINLWNHTSYSQVEHIASGETLGSTGWEKNQEYSFDITYNQSSLGVFVGDSLEFGITAEGAGVSEFSEGGFAFINFSQDSVKYKSVQFDDFEEIVSEEKKNLLANAVPVQFGAFAWFGLFGAGYLAKRKKGE